MLCLRLASPTFPWILCKCHQFAPGFRVNIADSVYITGLATLTSDRQGPGVWMRNPSSPCAWPCCQQDSGLESSLVWNSYVSCERPNCCFRSQICSIKEVSTAAVGEIDGTIDSTQEARAGMRERSRRERAFAPHAPSGRKSAKVIS